MVACVTRQLRSRVALSVACFRRLSSGARVLGLLVPNPGGMEGLRLSPGVLSENNLVVLEVPARALTVELASDVGAALQRRLAATRSWLSGGRLPLRGMPKRREERLGAL